MEAWKEGIPATTLHLNPRVLNDPIKHTELWTPTVPSLFPFCIQILCLSHSLCIAPPVSMCSHLSCHCLFSVLFVFIVTGDCWSYRQPSRDASGVPSGLRERLTGQCSPSSGCAYWVTTLSRLSLWLQPGYIYNHAQCIQHWIIQWTVSYWSLDEKHGSQNGPTFWYAGFHTCMGWPKSKS